MKIIIYVALMIGIAIAGFFFGQMYQSSGIRDMFEQSSKERDVTSGVDFYLTKDQVREAVELAGLGSKEAARKLYFYYSFYESNDSEAMKWQLALANMGDTFSQHALIKDYFSENDIRKRREGIDLCKAWLERPLNRE